MEKRKPGRPKGSLNKSTIARQEQEAAALVASMLPQSSQDESGNVEKTETVNDDPTPPPAPEPQQKPPRPQPKQKSARPSRAAAARPAPDYDDESSTVSDSPDEAVHRIKRRYKRQPSHKVKRRGARVIVLEDSSSSSDDDSSEPESANACGAS